MWTNLLTAFFGDSDKHLFFKASLAKNKKYLVAFRDFAPSNRPQHKLIQFSLASFRSL